MSENIIKKKSFLNKDKSDKFLDTELLKQVLRFALPYKLKIIIATLSLILAQFIPFWYPHILGELIDGPLVQGSFGDAIPYIGIYFGLTLSQSLLSFTSSMFSKLLALDVIHDLRTELFKRVLKFKIEFFHKTPVGRLMTRLTTDTDSLFSLFSEGLLDLLGMILMLIFATIFMLYKNTELALVTLAVLPFMVLITSIFRVKVRNINRIIREELAALNSTLQENLGGIRIVQIFGQQKKRFKLFDEHNKSYKEAFLKNVKYYSYFFPGLHGFSDISTMACYGLGAYLISQGQSSVGELTAFAWYATMFQRPLRDISDRITQLQSALAAGERVFTLMNTDAQITKKGTSFPKQHSIVFNDLNFGYSEDKQILKGLNFKIKSGESVAIVGATGSGKSTLITLINRHYTPGSGQIKIGNTDLREISEANLRENIANVSQDIMLFVGTVRENILFGNELDTERLEDILKKSRLDQIIDELEEGLDTVIKQGGTNLSAGQRQLISFARALYKPSKILLLDEATSSVDTFTEKLLQEALEELTRGRTSIIVAHRLSTIIGADKILVLHQGELVEQGKHQELIDYNGIYANLVKLNLFDEES
ncbi:ABC transporter ATP-binding protein/permease [Fibrobacterales bacterium]|nr:ABC transporter ATP-binding protein/permease [Fibrobacterales bacterium]